MLVDERPVVVIGAGPVGQTAALLLAHRGVPVVVLDTRPAREATGSKAICQQRDVLDVWDTVGAGRLLADEGVTWTTARTFYRGTELFCLHLQDGGRSPFPPFVNISQSRTEQVLDECLDRTPLAQVRWGHEVVAIEQDENDVKIRCATVKEDVVLDASYVLVCSGARGDRVRRMLGLSFEGSTFGDRFLICDIRTELPGWELERRFYFDPGWNPGRQVLIHPCPGSVFRIDWQVPEDFDLQTEEATGRLDARIRQVIGERNYELVWKSVYHFSSRVVDRMQVGRVLVAGDAAHLVAPFGARGLNSGVLDAENAAWKLSFVLHGLAPASLLASYHAERHAAARENLEVTAATMRFLVPQDEAARVRRREVLERARTDEDARAGVDSGRLAEPFWYVDSPLTTPDASRPFPGRPPNGQVPQPAPGVLAPDCPVTVPGRPELMRLRQLLRQGVTLLVGDTVNLGRVEQTAAGTLAPVSVYSMGALSPQLASVLGAKPDEVWVLRPDAHVAAVLPAADVDRVGEALNRLLAGTTPGRSRTLPPSGGHP